VAGRNIVVIGGSSGALEAVRTILSGLPPTLDASLFIVLHTSPDSPGLLDRLFGRVTKFPVVYPHDKERIAPRNIYVAPPDFHLLVKRSHLRLTRGPRENRFRPAIDPLFRSAATAHGPRVIGVILSGAQDDGAVGMRLIKSSGGVAIAQDPSEAIIPSMPLAAIRHVDVDHVLPASEIAEAIARLAAEPIAVSEVNMTDRERTDVSEAGSDAIHEADALGPPSPFTCPECGGTLWESKNGGLLQFKCHVGHRYSGDSLESAQAEQLDRALWAGLRALEESAELRRRMAVHARGQGMAAIASGYDDHAQESELRADVIRRVLMPESDKEPVGAEPESAAAVRGPK
jgi:two-component system chemotaxis response regulator CheB